MDNLLRKSEDLNQTKALNGDVWSWKMWLEFKKSKKKIVKKQIGLSSMIKKKSKRRKNVVLSYLY